MKTGQAESLNTYSTRELTLWAATQFQALEGANPIQDARTLMEWVCDVESWWQVPERVGSHAAERYRSAVARRRFHEPLQHIIGKMWFRTLTLEAQSGVFIVRPETELVAQVAIDHAQQLADLGHQPIVVDLATGSGAIALSVAVEVPESHVHAVELMPIPFSVATRNIGSIAPGRVHLLHGDALRAFPELNGQVDIVVSNPPYVPAAHVTQLEALHDPEEALYGGGDDGMILPRGFIHRASALLRPGGLLVMEHAENQSEHLRQTALSEGFGHVSTVQDFTGRDRMLVAWR